MGVSKNRGGKPPKMDGENNGKPYFLVDDLGEGPPLFLETPNMSLFLDLFWVRLKKISPFNP